MAAYDARSDFGDLAEEANRLALARWIVDRKKTRFGDLGLDGQQVIKEIVAGPPTLGSALGIVLRAYAARFDKPRWGDKRPGYFQRIPALLRMFPDAQVVQLIRDGRDCVASLKEMDWYKQDSLHALSTWVESIELGERAARSLGPGSYYRMYYERLISDPEKESPGSARSSVRTSTRRCASLGRSRPSPSPAARPGTSAPTTRSPRHARARGAHG